MARVAQDRLARLEHALAELPDVIAIKKKSGAKDATPRVSTTDPDARVMKIPDGGFAPGRKRPARHHHGRRSRDRRRQRQQSRLRPRPSHPHARTDRGPHRRCAPTSYSSIGGYPSHDAIDQVTAAGVTLYAPVPRPRNKAPETPDLPPIDPHLPKPGGAALAAWCVRVGTDDAKQIYQQRAATAETVNADAKAHRGMAATALRGLDKVTGCACLFALTYNLLRFLIVSA
jgi:hypothetical protein